MLLEDYSALIVTDEGTFHLDLKAGWITDWRSGSRALDIVAPKFGNGIYECLVFAHDTAYSGWVSKALADEVFVHQGFEFSGECGHTRAQLSYNAVRLFGSAYYMEDVMPKPYTDNRQYESLTLEAK